MKQQWPAPLRNREPILQVLRRVLPDPGLTLEIASGSGQHAAYMSEELPGIRWQPSDLDGDCVASISAWQQESGRDNFLPPLHLDTCAEVWPIEQADSVFCANMIHIAPWSSCLGLLRGAGQIIVSGGVLVLYGPFWVEGVPAAASNESFDRSLRSRNPEWGIRHLEKVQAVALGEGLVFEEQVSMPANNLSLIFRKA